MDHAARDYLVAAPVLENELCDPLSVLGINWEDSDGWHISYLSIQLSSCSSIMYALGWMLVCRSGPLPELREFVGHTSRHEDNLPVGDQKLRISDRIGRLAFMDHKNFFIRMSV